MIEIQGLVNRSVVEGGCSLQSRAVSKVELVRQKKTTAAKVLIYISQHQPRSTNIGRTPNKVHHSPPMEKTKRWYNDILAWSNWETPQGAFQLELTTCL